MGQSAVKYSISVKSELFKEKLTLFAYFKKIRLLMEKLKKVQMLFVLSAKMHMNLWREVDNLEIQFRIQITFV